MKTLIAYFSYTGHTKEIAQQIHNLTGGSLFEIQPTTSYSSDYNTTVAQGRKEARDRYCPSLTEQVTDLDTYDTILLGTPNWFNTMAPPVMSFLSENNMEGKNIAVFCTHGGGGLAHVATDIKALCKNSKIFDCLTLYEDGGSDAKAKISNWLNKITAL